MSAYRKHPGSAVAAGLFNGIFLVAVPYAVITLVLNFLQAQPPQFILTLAPVIVSLEGIRRNAVIFGGGAATFSALRALYPKGAPHRAGFGIGRQGFRFAYLAVVLNGGLLSLTLPLDFGGGPLGLLSGSLDLSRLFTLVYVAMGVTAAHGILEYIVHRKGLRLPPGYPVAAGYGGLPPAPPDDPFGPYPPPP